MQKIGKNNSSFKDRTGEIHTTKEGHEVQIIEYLGINKCTIKFKDGTIKGNLTYSNITKGSILKSKLGSVYITREGYEITIIDYKDKLNCTVEFKNGYKLSNTSLQNIKNGKVKNPFHATKYGVGYFGVGIHASSINRKHTKYYTSWSSMLERCYSKFYEINYPSYEECHVSKEWHNFQVFAQWYKDNWKPHMQGWELDKDILVKGNKIYSPETCCFVPSIINNLFKTDKDLNYFYKRGDKFEVSCSNKYIGTFDTLEDSFQAYKYTKEKYIRELADEWKDKIDSKVYQAMCEWKI